MKKITLAAYMVTLAPLLGTFPAFFYHFSDWLASPHGSEVGAALLNSKSTESS
jgi:hypothetical protein